MSFSYDSMKKRVLRKKEKIPVINEGFGKIIGVLGYFILFLVFIAIVLFLFRFFNHRELDDVHPDFECTSDLIEKSDVLWVTPFYKDKPISENKEWCAEIKALNKTLGLHGVYHEYNEFGTDRNFEYLQKGISEFEKCFGAKPKLFKAPQLELSMNNKRMIESLGLKVMGHRNQISHKVYHCKDSGLLPNWVIDWL